MLSIWRPENTASASMSWTKYSNPLINSALELLDEDKLDRQWVVRNVLGGMAAGFGLRGVFHNSTSIIVIDLHLNSGP
jgi:lipid intermediate transporter